MKVGIICFPGTNCDVDTFRASKLLGWDASYIWHEDKDSLNIKSLLLYDIIFLPGGFSYGDYLHSGRLASFSPIVDFIGQYIQKQRGIVVGICNGFQVLCESALLPGALVDNIDNKFICDEITLLTNHKNLPAKIKLPIAHKSGCYILPQEQNIDDKVLFRYENNVNGSFDSIAGVYDRERRVMGMMPHPERAVFDELDLSDGKYFFSFLNDEII